MGNKHNELYESPAATVVEVKTQGIICISGEVNATMNGVFSEETI
jgi:hypothetical protein